MADLLDYALTTVEDVKESLGISSSDHSKDNLIKRKINLATMLIETFCNLTADHHFKETTYTNEYYDGEGIDQLVLRMRPVTALTSFQYGDSSLNSGNFSDVESELYFLDGNAGTIDGLFTQNRNWSGYRVTYTAGYATIPADLAEAATSLAAFWVGSISAGSSGTAVKRMREGQREVEYFNAFGEGSNDSTIASLGLDDILGRYMIYSV